MTLSDVFCFFTTTLLFSTDTPATTYPPRNALPDKHDHVSGSSGTHPSGGRGQICEREPRKKKHKKKKKGDLRRAEPASVALSSLSFPPLSVFVPFLRGPASRLQRTGWAPWSPPGRRCSVTSVQHAPSLLSRTRWVLELYPSYRRPGGFPGVGGGQGARGILRSACGPSV